MNRRLLFGSLFVASLSAVTIACSDQADPEGFPGTDNDSGVVTHVDSGLDPIESDAEVIPIGDATVPLDAAQPPATLDAGPPRLIQHIVKPKDADPAVTTYLEPHYAYDDTRVAQRPELILWLTGAGGVPVGESQLISDLSGYGFHTIGLRYVDDYLIVDICTKDTDVDCHGKLRLEALDGMDHSVHINVPIENSIEGRLGKLLAYLQLNFPAEGWGQYLESTGKPKWPSIIVGGTSHGSSAAGRISKVRPLAGAIMSAGPYDNRAGVPAAWQNETPMTPPAKVWAFSHNNDTQFPQDEKNWAAMMLPGTPTFVDGVAAPWGGSHRLATARAGGSHGSSSHARDYPSVWKTMLNVP